MRFKWKGSGIEKSVVLCAKLLISFFARSQFPTLLRTSRFCEKGRVLRFAIPRCFEPTDQLASRHHLTKAKVLGITQIFKVGIKQGFVVIQQNVSGLERKISSFHGFFAGAAWQGERNKKVFVWRLEVPEAIESKLFSARSKRC